MPVPDKKFRVVRRKRKNFGLRGKRAVCVSKKGRRPAACFCRAHGFVDAALAYLLVNGGILLKKHLFTA